MRKFYSLITHPIIIIIIVVILYEIGVKNYFIRPVENVRLHFFYIILIIIGLGFVGGHHFINKLNQIKIYDYNNKIYFKDKSYYDSYRKIFSEGIEIDNPNFKTLSYVDHIICYVRSSSYNLYYHIGIFFFIGLISNLNQIYINEGFIYIFINFYFTICLSLIYLKIHERVVRSSIKNELGSNYDDYVKYHYDILQFEIHRIKALFFYIPTIIILIFYILNSYKII
jgi:hypothetical protein